MISDLKGGTAKVVPPFALPMSTASTGLSIASSYNVSVVLVSFLIAALASFVALGLARRLYRASSSAMGRIWWGSGALIMGTGIWAMHFVGMQAFQAPITLGYEGSLTLLSWAAAVFSSAVALGIAANSRIKGGSWWAAAVAMAGGIAGMHFLGMHAIQMSIPIEWDYALVAVSLGVALLASAAALAMLRAMQYLQGHMLLGFQVLASAVMALAICGMHYIGMAAASFAEGAECLSANALNGPELTLMITITTTVLLVATLLVQALDARFQSTSFRLNRSLRISNARLQAANEELRQRAFTDPLTLLPNRLLLEDRLSNAILRLNRTNHHGVQEYLAVLFVDLDGFKPINDSFGHAVGDAVLQGVAQRLKAQSRSCDTVARVGGDEFLLLLENIHSLEDGLLVAQRVLQALAQAFEVMGRKLHISGSIGVALYPAHSSAQQLIAHADTAMYEAKRKGGNACVVFEPAMGKDPAEQLQLQNDLRTALQTQQISMYYQPKVDAQSGHVMAVEALMRWHHPVHGMVSPQVFIPLAERCGMIHALGQLAITQSCRQLGLWARQGLRMRVAINISVQQLRASDLADFLAKSMCDHGLQPQQVLCEITESVAMEDTQTTQRALEQLRQLGVYLSIDDFGTGYSSLSYLRQLQVQQIKVDRSFIQDIDSSEAARAVVKAVIDLAHALGLRVIAEGVENVAQRDILLSMGCDGFQGFLFARPMPAEQLWAWMHAQPTSTPHKDALPHWQPQH